MPNSGDLSRETKYDFSMERLVDLLDAYCTFPAIEKVKLLKRSLFNFLVGNEDMHLKNFSLISRQGKVELAPAYDYLSTTVAFLALGKPIETIEEIALPLQGKKRGLGRKTWMDYFARERLKLPDKVVRNVRGRNWRAPPPPGGRASPTPSCPRIRRTITGPCWPNASRGLSCKSRCPTSSRPISCENTVAKLGTVTHYWPG